MLNWKFFLKLALVALLFVFLSQKGLISVEATKSALSQWQYILPAFIAMFISALIAVYRWHILLRAQEIELKPRKIFELAFVGNFFNIALPGAVSGDVIKAIYVAKQSPGKRAQALSSILFDRLAGVSGLVLVSAGAWFFSLFHPVDNKVIVAIEYVVGISGLAVILFFLYLFLVKESFDPLLSVLRKLQDKYKVVGSLTRIYEGIRNYHHQKAIVIFSLALSLIIHCLVIFAFIQFTKAIGEDQILNLSLFIVVPLGLLVTAIPILPAGMGTGHAAFLALYHLLGSERGVDVFNLYILYMLAQGILGGLIYLQYKSDISISE